MRGITIMKCVEYDKWKHRQELISLMIFHNAFALKLLRELIEELEMSLHCYDCKHNFEIICH